MFDCLPCYPLDSARILWSSVEAVASRRSIDGPERVATAALVGASVVVAGAVLLVLSSPFLSG